MSFAHVAALVVALGGCVTDLRTRRIPNLLTVGAALVAFGYHGFTGGLSGLGVSIGGWLVGGVIFLPLFAVRGLGGGDVKLMAALGAWIGPTAAVWLALYTALAGGVFALLVALSRGYVRQALSNVWSILVFWRIAGIQEHPVFNVDSTRAVRMPYALPIAAGLVTTIWLR